MAWFNRASDLIAASSAVADAVRQTPSGFVDSLTLPSWMDWAGVTADEANRVPAFNRATRLISGTVAQLPLVTWRGDTITDGTGLIRQPEADRPAWVTIQRLVRDMAWYGAAFWEVRDTDATGYPVRVRTMPAAEVAPSITRPDTHVTFRGRDYPVSHPAGPGTNIGHVIVFHGFSEGVLHAGAQTLGLAIALEDAARRYADTPLPSIALRNTGADMPKDQVEEMLTAWETARAKRSTAYLNSVMETETFGFSPAELTLNDARNFAAIEIARLFNLDSFWIGANLPGASVSYSNRVDLRKDLVDLTLADYMVPIEQRLSMRDVTPTFTTNLVRFDTSAFLRSNLTERASIAVSLAGAGLVSTDEAREFLRDNPTPGGGLS